MGKKTSRKGKKTIKKARVQKSPATGSAAGSTLPLANITSRGSAPRPSAFSGISSTPEKKEEVIEEKSQESAETGSLPPVPDVEKFGMVETPAIAEEPEKIEESMAEPIAMIEEAPVESEKPAKPAKKSAKKASKKPGEKKIKETEPKVKETPEIVQEAVTEPEVKEVSEITRETEAVTPSKPVKSPSKKGKKAEIKAKVRVETTEIPPELAPVSKPVEVSASMIDAIKSLGDRINLEDSVFQVKNIKEIIQFAAIKIAGKKKVRGLSSEKIAFKRNAITAGGFKNYKDFKNAKSYDFELLHFGDPAAKILIAWLELISLPDLSERLANKFAQLKPEGGAIRVNCGGAFRKKDGTLGTKGNVFITFDWPGKSKYNKEPDAENIIDAKNLPADVEIWFTKWAKERSGKIPRYVYFALKHQKELAKELGKKKLSSLSKNEKKAILEKIADKLKIKKKELEGEATWSYPALNNQYRVCSYSAIAKKIQKLGKGMFVLTSGVAHPSIDKDRNPEEFFSYKLRSASQAMAMKCIIDTILTIADNVNDIMTEKGYLEMKTITPDIISHAIAKLGYFKSSIMNLAMPELELTVN